MFRIFSKSRKNLFSTKVGKYLVYAIGEIFLIVAGILIAMYLNDWNNRRKLEKETTNLLLNFKDDLVSRAHRYKLLNTPISQSIQYLKKRDDDDFDLQTKNVINRISISSYPTAYNNISNEILDLVSENLNDFSETKKAPAAAIMRLNDFSKSIEGLIVKYNSYANRNHTLLFERANFLIDETPNSINNTFNLIHNDYQFKNNLTEQEKLLEALNLNLKIQHILDISTCVNIEDIFDEKSNVGVDSLLIRNNLKRINSIMVLDSIQQNHAQNMVVFTIFNESKDTVEVSNVNTIKSNIGPDEFLATYAKDSSLFSIKNIKTDSTFNYQALDFGYVLYE